jgi:glycerate kinase
MTAREAARAIENGLTEALSGAEIALLPLADGGPGTVEALVEATGGKHKRSLARDALGRPAKANWGVLGDGTTAAIEMAAASGLEQLGRDERDPRATTTIGTGDLLRAALNGGYRAIIIGMGGSATNDGGAGLAQALGARFLDADGHGIEPGGAALAGLERIDVSGVAAELRDAKIVVATDVRNPLLGAEGASMVYGPQKGASEAVARELDAALARYAAVIKRDLGVDVDVPGAGAAGGTPAALIALCGARIESGFGVIAEAVRLRERIEGADVVVTGEGKLDSQSAQGKTTWGVAQLAREVGRPVVAVAGTIQDTAARNAFDAAFAVVPDVATLDEALAQPREMLAAAARRAGEWLDATYG